MDGTRQYIDEWESAPVEVAVSNGVVTDRITVVNATLFFAFVPK